MINYLKYKLRPLPIPPAWAKFLPASSRAFGPPRRSATLNDFIARHGGELRPAPVQLHQPLPPWTPLDDKSAAIASGFIGELPPASVFSITDARLIGPDGWIVGSDDTFLPESSFWTFSTSRPRLTDHPIYQRKKASRIHHLPGTVLSLASEFSVGSVGHLLSDSLVRLHLFYQAGYTLDDVDWVYFPRIAGANTEFIAGRLGLPRDRVLNWEPGIDLQCERLIATTFPGLPGNPPSDSIAFIQRLVETPVANPTGRIYLNRQGSRRKICNHDAIAAILRTHHFVSCPPESTPDIVTKCANARYIVSAEGSNFNNVIFCPKGTSILLIRAPELHSPPYSYTLAGACGHHLHAMTALPAPNGQLQVDPSVFAAALETVLRT